MKREGVREGSEGKEKTRKGHTFPLKLEKLATGEKRGKERRKGKLAVAV